MLLDQIPSPVDVRSTPPCLHLLKGEGLWGNSLHVSAMMTTKRRALLESVNNSEKKRKSVIFGVPEFKVLLKNPSTKYRGTIKSFCHMNYHLLPLHTLLCGTTLRLLFSIWEIQWICESLCDGCWKKRTYRVSTAGWLPTKLSIYRRSIPSR